MSTSESKPVSKGISRRTFIGTSVGTLVAGALIGTAAGYYLLPAKSSPTTTTTTKALTSSQILNNPTLYDPSSMDPHKVADEPTMRYAANLYDPLIGIDGYVAPLGSGGTTWFNIAPRVAKSWQVSSDGLTYTFEITDGIKFHDGSTLDANAVKYSFDRTTTINQNLSAQLISGIISSTSVVDSSHVQVALKNPYTPFLQVLSTLFIVNPSVITPNVKSSGPYGSNGDYGTAWLETHDAGSGPYTLTQRQTGVLTVEDRFPDYWGGWGPQYFDELRFNIIPDAATIVSDISSGAGDWMDYWESNDQYIALSKTAGVTVPEWIDPAGTFTILLNNQNQYLKNKSVRQAISYAFDYNTCINSVWEGLGSQKSGTASTRHDWVRPEHSGVFSRYDQGTATHVAIWL